jgi:anti-anti-sigma factor
MDLQAESLPNGVEKLSLAGRLDTAGVQEIDLRFTALAASRKALVLVDLSGVSFLASIGVRMLVVAAKALGQRGGRMALLNPQPGIGEVLRIARIDSIVPTFYDLASAVRMLKDSPAGA